MESISINEKQINVELALYLFMEDKLYIAYSPSFDLSAAGKTADEALNEFNKIFKLHIEYCLENKTLFADLKKYGWILDKTKAKAPNVLQLLDKNNTFKDIISNKKNYQRITHPAHIQIQA